MKPTRIFARLIQEADRAAYDDRPVTRLSATELRVWQETQSLFHAAGEQRLNLPKALAHLDAKLQAGVVDEAFACSAACVLLCDTAIGELDRAAEFCDRQERAAFVLAPGLRRDQMLAGASRHRATMARRRGQPQLALELDRSAWARTDHPRDQANVLIDLLRCGQEAQARQLLLETQLTRDPQYLRALERIIHDDIDLALLVPAPSEGSEA